MRFNLYNDRAIPGRRTDIRMGLSDSFISQLLLFRIISEVSELEFTKETSEQPPAPLQLRSRFIIIIIIIIIIDPWIILSSNQGVAAKMRDQGFGEEAVNDQ